MINLLPAQLKTDRRYGRRNRVLLNYSLVVLAIGLTSTLVMLFNAQLATKDKQRLQTEIAAKQADVSKLQKDQEKLLRLAGDLKTIDKLYKGEIIFSELMPQIGGLLPAGTVLNGLTLTGGSDDPVSLEIDMTSQELAAVFQQNLISSDLFEAADIVNITTRGEGSNGEEYSYSATISAKFKDSKKPTTSNNAEAETNQTSEAAQ